MWSHSQQMNEFARFAKRLYKTQSLDTNTISFTEIAQLGLSQKNRLVHRVGRL
jgi:hypothetical protein